MEDQSKKTIWLITLADKTNSLHAGIVSKAYAQKEALVNLGYATEMFLLQGNEIIDQRGKVLNKIYPVAIRFGFFSFLKTKMKNEKKAPDILYIRYPFTTLSFLSFLRNVRRNYKTCKTVVEFPTYPYKNEFQGWSKIKYYYDQFLFDFAKKNIDLAAVIGNKMHISGVKTTFLSNSIKIPEFSPKNNPDKNVFGMLAIGNWNDWHGLDRVIIGLENYYQNHPYKKVKLHVIGEGNGLQNIKSLVRSKKLEEHVLFYGKKEEKEIDKICSFCHIGVGVLGIHRKGLNHQSPLKHRYYISRGLPLFYSTKDDDLSENLPFVFMCEENDDPVAISEIIEFTKKCPVSSIEIWDFANDHLRWEGKFIDIFHTLCVHNREH